MNKLAILLDKEAHFETIIVEFAYKCTGVGGSSVRALAGVDADLDVPTTRQ